MEKIPNNGEYISPEINVIEIKNQEVLCASGNLNDPFYYNNDPDWFD